MERLADNLGGHANITHVDNGALKCLIEELDIKSFVDIGCATGGMVYVAKEMGIKKVLGIDGDYTIEFMEDIQDDIMLHNFCKGPVKTRRKFDLGWCVEFLEHIDEEYLDNVFDIFKRCKYIVCTASPQKNNPFHVNAQDLDYWIRLFKENGFEHDDNMLEYIKLKSTMKRQFLQENGMFFANENNN